MPKQHSHAPNLLGCTRLAMGALATLPLLLSSPLATAGPIVEDGLEAFLTFSEGAGDTTADQSGNGHTGTLISTSWGDGYVTCSSEGNLVSVDADSSMRSPSFTYDLWFEASNGTGAYGRIVAQAARSGGNGPDVLENYGYPALRISSGNNAAFDTPSVGSLSTPAPPDHFGICAEKFHRNDGPEHLVVTHDASTKTVKMFIGLPNAPLRLCFEAQYSGNYSVDTGALGICNHPDPDHVFRGNYYQFAYYSRTLSAQINGSHEVTGGELHTNHQAGPDAEVSSPPMPDAGVPDAGAPTGPADAGEPADTPDAGMENPSPAELDAGDAPAAEANTADLTGGCAIAATPDQPPWPLLVVFMLWFVRSPPRRRSHRSRRQAAG